jgi:hypothetical protein
VLDNLFSKRFYTDQPKRDKHKKQQHENKINESKCRTEKYHGDDNNTNEVCENNEYVLRDMLNE